MRDKSMIECKACGKDIVKGKHKCPHCGKHQRNFFMRHKVLTGILVVLVVILIVSSGGDSNNPKTVEDNKVAQTGITKDNVPREHKSALRKAETYAKTMHMSKAGVYDQLVSEHGESFPEVAAQYAIDNMKADWKSNALKKAETYAKTMYMSKAGVYDQLISQHGEQFTEEEAQYAIANMKADWKANALKKAETYAKTMDMSNAAIYEQLVSKHGEGFTKEEAQYAVDNLK